MPEFFIYYYFFTFLLCRPEGKDYSVHRIILGTHTYVTHSCFKASAEEENSLRLLNYNVFMFLDLFDLIDQTNKIM